MFSLDVHSTRHRPHYYEVHAMRKHALMFVLLAVLLPVDLFGQNRISSVSLGSGQDAISSGMTGILRFESKDKKLFGEFAAQHEQAWFAIGRQLNGRVSGFVAGDVGHFQGAPWYGPYVSLSTPLLKIGNKDLSISTLQWPAIFVSNPSSKTGQKLNGFIEHVGYLSSFSLTLGPVSLNHAMLHFLNDPWNSLPGASITLPITGEVSGTTSYTRNVNGKFDMYFMGVSWTPSSK